MAAVDLDKLTVRELNDVIETAQALIVQKEKEERQAALAAAREAAAKLGYDLDDLLQEQPAQVAATQGRRGLRPKFRHPENPTVTWSGVGRKPKWAAEAEAEGKLEELRIPE